MPGVLVQLANGVVPTIGRNHAGLPSEPALHHRMSGSGRPAGPEILAR
jgi:hypothetical protein